MHSHHRACPRRRGRYTRLEQRDGQARGAFAGSGAFEDPKKTEEPSEDGS
jgi:hypothetical protein